jgi:hypothetical protein
MTKQGFSKLVQFFRYSPNRHFAHENVFRIVSDQKKYLFEIAPFALAHRLFLYPCDGPDYHRDTREPFHSNWRKVAEGTLDEKALNFTFVEGVPDELVGRFAEELARESEWSDLQLSDFWPAEVLLRGRAIKPGLTIGSLRPQKIPT